MKKVLLVDDDTIVRTMLHSLVDWNRYGYEIAADASNGEQAFRWMQEHSVDLLVTDMKMPIMDGLELLRKLNRQQQLPCTVVLSSYDDFKMVRESFRMGACDYLLKSDLNEEMLGNLLARLKQEYLKDTSEENRQDQKPPKTQLAEMALGKYPLEETFFEGDYYVIQFEIDDFSQHVSRFSPDLEGGLTEPMLEFARQIPRVAARCVLCPLSPSRYLMLYRVTDRIQSRDNVVSTCKQLKNVWNNYMNLPVSAGISNLGSTAAQFLSCMEEAGSQLELHYLKGRSSICFPWEKGQITAEAVERLKNCYEPLVRGLRAADELTVEAEKQALCHRLQALSLGDSREECLIVITLVARGFQDTYHNIWSIFQEDINYYQKLERLMDSRSLEIWMSNYLRWILDYQTNVFDNRQADMMIRAKRFILDNYSNPELTLGSVAGYVGLNEKYFSSRFTKETGSTFSNYLMEVRIRKSRELMDKTDMKMYEISRMVGYNNVEHFNRVFKKVCQISPSAYKKSEPEKS